MHAPLTRSGIAFVAWLAACWGSGVGLAAEAEPKIISVTKIWDAGEHNAFTDLIRWRGKWYCTFREADGHVGGDGKLRVLESVDGTKWESVALLAEKGIDLRDPKLSITPDDRLMMTAGGSVYEGKKLLGRQPRVAFSQDAKDWTPTQRVLTEGEWLWRVTWHGGQAYGASYNAAARTTPAAQEAAKSGKSEPGPAEWKLKLVVSPDGVNYQVVTHLDVPGHPNETTLRFLPSGELVALVRREGGNTFGWIGRSLPPYRDWTWKETKHRLGGPNFTQLPDGQLWAAGRVYPGGAKNALARMTVDGGYEPVLTLPSGGDTSYPGLVWHDGLLWMSYYSSHEGKTSIYLAKLSVPLKAEPLGKSTVPFVDDYWIDRITGNLQLVPQRPIPKQIALTADQPWEGNTSAYFAVIQDEGKFRLYYRGSHYDENLKKATHPEVTCYAESTDGLHFTKPELGIVEFEGSKANNIILMGRQSHCFAPFKDLNPRCEPDAKYKAVTAVEGGLLPLKSADGIHWTPMADKPVITRGAFDSQNLAFFDPDLGLYREYHRAFRTVRDIMTGTSPDFLQWTEPVWLDYSGAEQEHLYTNAVQNYPGVPGLLIGFPTRFLPKREQTEPTLMVSRNGQTFHRYPQAVIPTTAPEKRDGNRSNYMAWGMVTVPNPDGDGDWTVYAKEAYYTGPGSRIRRFVYRRDGLVALSSRADGDADAAKTVPHGEAITRPLVLAGKSLVVNFRTQPMGSLQIEILDEAGEPIAPFTADKCRLAGDELAEVAHWGEDADLASLAGRPVRLRFILRDTELFSIREE